MSGYTIPEIPGFYKVGESFGSSLVQHYLYNPESGESRRELVDDYEYDRWFVWANNPLAEAVYKMPVAEPVAEYYEFRRAVDGLENGIAIVGCDFEVVAGRKYPKGAKGTVTKVYDYFDKFGRFVAKYMHGIDDEGNFYKMAQRNAVFTPSARTVDKLEDLRRKCMDFVAAEQGASVAFEISATQEG